MAIGYRLYVILLGISTTEFQWEAYLRKERGMAAPAHLFAVCSPNAPASAVGLYSIGMKLEASDKQNPQIYYVASIRDMLGVAAFLPLLLHQGLHHIPLRLILHMTTKYPNRHFPLEIYICIF